MKKANYLEKLRAAVSGAEDGSLDASYLFTVARDARFHFPESGNAVIMSDLAGQLADKSYESIEERRAMLNQLIGIALRHFL